MKDIVQSDRPNFIPGLDLSEHFYNDAIRPILDASFAGFSHSAALIGSGSEVLGLDTQMSSDHHWGPRALLFLSPGAYEQYRDTIVQTLRDNLPRTFLGYPTSFTRPNPEDHGTQLLDYATDSPINHRVELHTLATFFWEYLGFDIGQEIQLADWLTFPEHKLATIAAGRIFHDDLGLQTTRQRFTYYPHDVWLYLLASGWTRIEQEEHLMGRAGLVGDEIGSAIIASRLVRDIMRLCFLMERRYAPYPKWFGTAFSRLTIATRLEPLLRQVLSAQHWEERQKHLTQAYECIATLHNSLGITQPMPTKVTHFFDRPFLVMSMGAFSKAISATITDPTVRKLTDKRLIGSIDQFSDSTDILSEPGWRTTLRELYT
ncbi:MAG: DUF4037 domain-containing protein [Candidatus Melainabacteria bacterium]|nr:DUF4037 domain-containing protein [Candidatus Melainabacteria bacterium]